MNEFNTSGAKVAPFTYVQLLHSDLQKTMEQSCLA